MTEQNNSVVFDTVTVKKDITEDRIKSLLCSAFEGGSNDWLVKYKYNFAEGLKKEDFKEGGRLNPKDNYYHPCQIVPMTEGCSLTIYVDEDDKTYTLDRAALKKGLALMAEKYPGHMGQVIEENDDASTGDLFMQLCLFNELVYC